MEQELIARASAVINAPTSKVWEALTKPELVKQYLFGTDMTTDWKIGSPITYKGEWQGKAYEDKGTVLEVVPEKKIVTTYWSGFSGKPDAPENYYRVTYAIAPEGNGTEVTITQSGKMTEESKAHTEKNWNLVLDSMKKLLES